MTVSLTTDQANKKIAEIEAAANNAQSAIKQMRQNQEHMLNMGWHGDSANAYGNTSQAQMEDFQKMSNMLNNIVEKGSEHIRSLGNADQH
jgi:uncharacterized protein YukE